MTHNILIVATVWIIGFLAGLAVGKLVRHRPRPKSVTIIHQVIGPAQLLRDLGRADLAEYHERIMNQINEENQRGTNATAY